MSEIIFAITALLGIAFRPRLAKIHEHNLFSIDAVSTYRDLGYQVKPDSKINFELIRALGGDFKVYNNSQTGLFEGVYIDPEIESRRRPGPTPDNIRYTKRSKN